MKLVYYLAAIGQPNYDVKLEILLHNIRYLKKQNIGIELIVNAYDDSFKIDAVEKIVDSCNIHRKKGVLTELWHSNPFHNLIKDKYMLFILDDIKLINYDVKQNVILKQKFKLDLFSPKVIKATHGFMQIKFNGLITTNRVEVYCLLLTFKDFEKYLEFNPVWNKWIWGVDLIMGYLGFSPGINFCSSVEHMLESKADRGEARMLMMRYLDEKKITNQHLSLPIFKEKYIFS
jgi:hypothetical protein